MNMAMGHIIQSGGMKAGDPCSSSNLAITNRRQPYDHPWSCTKKCIVFINTHQVCLKSRFLVQFHCISSDVLPFKCSCKVRQRAIWTSLERAILRGNSTFYRVTNVPPRITKIFSYTNKTLCKTVRVTMSHTTKPFHDTQMCSTDITLHITLHLNSSSKHSNTFQAISTASNGENTWNFQTGEMAPQLEMSWLLPCIQETAPCCR